MLSRAYKITSREFSLIPRRGYVFSNTIIRASHYSPLKNYRNPKFAVVVSKKVSPSSVIRNRIRRIFFSCIERKKTLFPPGFYVFSPQTHSLTSHEIEHFLDDFCGKICE